MQFIDRLLIIFCFSSLNGSLNTNIIDKLFLMHYFTIIVSSVAITDNNIEEWKSEEDCIILQKCITRKPTSASGTISYSDVSISLIGIDDFIMHCLTFLQQQQSYRDSLGGGAFCGYELGSVVPTFQH